MICSECGYNNRAGVLVCDNCGSDIYDTLLGSISTRKLPKSETRELAGDGSLASSTPLVFYVTSSDQPIAVPRLAEISIGRNEGDVVVDVDLGPYGGQDGGVSRRHVLLNASSNPPMLTDLDSYNGTFVNGVKLLPQQPFALKSGDEVRLGHLALRLYYK
jgi:hypothetical protein